MPVKKDHTKLDWTIVPTDWIPVLQEWIEYKEQRREYYVPLGWKKLIAQLKNQYINVQDLQAAIDNSMAKNYRGIFPSTSGTNTSFSGSYDGKL